MTVTLVLNGWAASERAWDLCAFRRDRVLSYSEQLDGLADRALDAATDGAVLVGWSMGGSTALRLAASRPHRIRGLVLVAATPRMMAAEGWRGMTPRRLEALHRGLELTCGEGFLGRPEGVPNPYLMDDGANLRRGLDYLLETDLRPALEAAFGGGRPAPFPVAIFQSRRDGIVPCDHAAYLSRLFPQAAVTFVDGGEHALPVTVPAAIDAAVARMAPALRGACENRRTAGRGGRGR